MLWLRFFTRTDMRALLAGLKGAFAFFGGVTQHPLFDQMRSTITKNGPMNGEKLLPLVHFERHERALLQPLPARPYHSLILDHRPRRSGDTKIYAPQVPLLTVERRPLAHYAELVGGGQ